MSKVEKIKMLENDQKTTKLRVKGQVKKSGFPSNQMKRYCNRFLPQNCCVGAHSHKEIRNHNK